MAPTAKSSPGISLYSHVKTSLNSFNSRINSAFSSFDSFELIEIGLDFYGSVPKSISFSFFLLSLARLFSATTSLSLFVSFSSSKLSYATQHTKLLCHDPRSGPPRVL